MKVDTDKIKEWLEKAIDTGEIEFSLWHKSFNAVDMVEIMWAMMENQEKGE